MFVDAELCTPFVPGTQNNVSDEAFVIEDHPALGLHEFVPDVAQFPDVAIRAGEVSFSQFLSPDRPDATSVKKPLPHNLNLSTSIQSQSKVYKVTVPITSSMHSSVSMLAGVQGSPGFGEDQDRHVTSFEPSGQEDRGLFRQTDSGPFVQTDRGPVQQEDPGLSRQNYPGPPRQEDP